MTLQRRKPTYAYASRTVVPADLRSLISRREIVRSLETSNLRAARIRAAQWEGHVATLFRRLRERSRMMDRSQLDALIAQYLDAALAEVETNLAEGLPLTDDNSLEEWCWQVQERIEETEFFLAKGIYRTTIGAARSMLPSGSETTIAILARRLLEARHEALLAELGALSGKPLPRRAAAAPAAALVVAPSLSGVVNDYVAFKRSGGKWALARQVGGDRSAAEAALRTLIDKEANDAAYQIAQVYALRNDAKATFEWLDRAWTNRDAGIAQLLYDPFILRFKDDPRFAAYCRKVGLPVPGEVRQKT